MTAVRASSGERALKRREFGIYVALSMGMSANHLNLLALGLTMFFFNNCSGVHFGEASSASTGDTGEYAVELGQPNPTVPTPAVQINPKVTFIGPPCQRLSLCQAQFQLDKAYSLPTEFDWRTNDTLYLTPHTPIYAQPGVHYNSKSGHLVFAPGETVKTISIQNINNYSAEVIIGVIMSQCKYGTYTGSCTAFFQ